MSDKSPNIVLPQGGGALNGMGEKFSADLFTGTGNFSVPIAVPPGRNGFEPHLSLGYSTGSGNGTFGLGWGLSVPGVMRKVDRGIPVYDDDQDIFILSGAEDLVPIKRTNILDSNGATTGYSTQYRPRTEGLFARIEHIKDGTLGNYWQVKTKDGLTSFYGTPGTSPQPSPGGEGDGCVIANPTNRHDIFAWRLFKTIDPFGNHIIYSYTRDLSLTKPHIYDQLYLSQIQYCDYGDPAAPSYLVQINFLYETRPDAFSAYKQGFEVRMTQRCNKIEIYTNAASLLKTKTYHFTYLDETVSEALLPLNRVSLLSSVQVEGYDGDLSEWMPPLEMSYSSFDPNGKT
ncbi:MAG: SpvB/TcaC N-terminal domain-containing protein, partial [Legionellales bacterium]